MKIGMRKTIITAAGAALAACALAGSAHAAPTHSCGTVPFRAAGTVAYVGAGPGTSCATARWFDEWVLTHGSPPRVNVQSITTGKWYVLTRHRMASGAQYIGPFDRGGSLDILLTVYE